MKIESLIKKNKKMAVPRLINPSGGEWEASTCDPRRPS